VRVHTGVRLISVAAIAACVTIYATPVMLTAPTGATIVATVLVAAFVGTLLWHSRDGDPHGAISAAGATMFAIALLGLMPGFFLAIRRWHAGWVVLAIILITKSGDIGAYFTGRLIGRHKLIPWLSPKKTWEGLAGGVALAALVAVGFAWISQSTDLAAILLTADHGERELVVRRYDLWIAALAGAFFALVGHAGDLMMSLFKRDAGVKDSGAAIPGFGGLLDVIDSILLVAPVAFWMLELASRSPAES
jgi:phosphatidate cytidylyltransferase